MRQRDNKKTNEIKKKQQPNATKIPHLEADFGCNKSEHLHCE